MRTEHNYKHENNIFNAIAAAVAKSELSELYLAVGKEFTLLPSLETVHSVIANALQDMPIDAHELIQAHFNMCDGKRYVAFRDGCSGVITTDNVAVEFDVKAIGVNAYRVLFARVDAAKLLTDTQQNRLDDLTARDSLFWNEARQLSATDVENLPDGNFKRAVKALQRDPETQMKDTLILKAKGTKRVHQKESFHILNGCLMILVGVWIANGNLVSIGGLVTILGCLSIIVELHDVADEMAERQVKRQEGYYQGSSDNVK